VRKKVKKKRKQDRPVETAQHTHWVVSNFSPEFSFAKKLRTKEK